jgi:hypothetical protein
MIGDHVADQTEFDKKILELADDGTAHTGNHLKVA